MATNHKTALVERFFSGTGSQYDRFAKLCTFGFDVMWKKRILEKIPDGSKRIMDQACGTGILTFEIAQRFPESRVVGVELRDEYLRIAREKARALNIDNAEFILGRAEDVFLEDGFDCITSSYLAKYAELDLLVRNNRKMLREGGVLVMHDFTYPSNRAFALIWEFYFKLLQTIGSSLYPQWKTIFDELPGLLKATRWVDELTRALDENAFSEVDVTPLTFHTAAIVSARKS